MCFEDEAGQQQRPPKGHTWGRRGITPIVKVDGRSSGKVSVAGLIAWWPGERTRFCYRIGVHRARGLPYSPSLRTFSIGHASDRQKHRHAGAVEQVAEMLSVGRDKIYYLLRSRQLKSIKIGKFRRITDQHLADFVSSLEPMDES